MSPADCLLTRPSHPVIRAYRNAVPDQQVTRAPAEIVRYLHVRVAVGQRRHAMYRLRRREAWRLD